MRAVLALASAVCVAALALAGVAHADVTVVEGHAFTGTVVDLPGCGLSGATISWGDASPTSPGTSDGATGVQGTHTYREAGGYSGSVAYTCTQFSGVHTASFSSAVADAPLTASGRAVTATTGQAASTVVAHVDDGNPLAAPGDFLVQVSWGDGSAAGAGTIVSAATGGFDVTASHTYATAGTFTVTSAITDIGGSTASAGATATVTDPPPPPLVVTPPPPTGTFTQLPVARVTVKPDPPCADQPVDLDASASSGGGNPINRFTWTLDSPGGQTIAPYHDTETRRPDDPVFTWTFPSVPALGRYRGIRTFSTADGPVRYRLYDYILRRPPVTVTLTVTGLHLDANNHDITGSETKTLTFANAVQTEEVGFEADNAWAIPGFAAPTLVVPGTVAGRCRLTSVDLFGESTRANTIALAALTAAPPHLAKHRSIIVQSRCADPLKSCTALLDVLPAQTRYRVHGHVAASVIRRSLAASLGTATFVVAAGTKSTQTVVLNARGRALARAGKLHRATLVLGSVGAKGKIVLTTRKVRFR